MIWAETVWLFQLTTSQGGRPTSGALSSSFLIVSTHDLARRSTKFENQRFNHGSFQLTTSQGGRPLKSVLSYKFYCFNSRPRKEVDGVVWYYMGLYLYVSTHDLARRSTAIFTQKVFLSKSLFVLIAYNIFILY